MPRATSAAVLAVCGVLALTACGGLRDRVDPASGPSSPVVASAVPAPGAASPVVNPVATPSTSTSKAATATTPVTTLPPVDPAELARLEAAVGAGESAAATGEKLIAQDG